MQARSARRALATAVAAMVGAVASLTAATPSQAATTCSLTYTVSGWQTSTGVRYYTTAYIKNTGSAPSTNWSVVFEFASGTTIQLYWNVRRSASSETLYNAADWNKQLSPNASANFGFQTVTSGPSVPVTPTTATCSISY